MKQDEAIILSNQDLMKIQGQKEIILSGRNHDTVFQDCHYLGVID